MLTIDSLFHLVNHYHLSDDIDCFNKAIDMASKELPSILDIEREYPPFVYYLCLEHMDKNSKYKFGKTFRSMNDSEKTEVFNETIQELRKLLAI
jgi:hypothetical protein